MEYRKVSMWSPPVRSQPTSPTQIWCIPFFFMSVQRTPIFSTNIVATVFQAAYEFVGFRQTLHGVWVMFPFWSRQCPPCCPRSRPNPIYLHTHLPAVPTVLWLSPLPLLHCHAFKYSVDLLCMAVCFVKMKASSQKLSSFNTELSLIILSYLSFRKLSF